MHILHCKGSFHLQLKLCLAPLWQMLASAPAPDEAFGCFGASAVAGFDISTLLPLRGIAWPGCGWQQGSATAWHQTCAGSVLGLGAPWVAQHQCLWLSRRAETISGESCPALLLQNDSSSAQAVVKDERAASALLRDSHKKET